MERTSSRIVVLFLTGHALAAAWTWRDIQHQPAATLDWTDIFTGSLPCR